MTKQFQATKSHKILIASATTFALFSAVSLWLWQAGNLPLYVGLISVAITCFPVVEICENRLRIIGWFGIKQQFDLSAPLELASTGDEIVLKQGRVGAGLGRYVIGKDQFDEVVQILSESIENVGM